MERLHNRTTHDHATGQVHRVRVLHEKQADGSVLQTTRASISVCSTPIASFHLSARLPVALSGEEGQAVDTHLLGHECDSMHLKLQACELQRLECLELTSDGDRHLESPASADTW
jgi:hypothetical protein